jgi:hypothetical protein
VTVNRFGLSRAIPEEVRREVRRRSKFGCVVCRCAFYQYEHIDPEFVDAKSHDPAHICLLCGHCHDKVTRGVLSKKSVTEKYSDVQTSSSVTRPFDEFDLNTNQISVTIGACTFRGATTLIKLDNRVALAIEPPEEGAAFPTLSGYFTDNNGNELFRIERNVWSGAATTWDLEVRGRLIILRLDSRTIALQIEVNPPTNIHVQVLDMRLGNAHLRLKTNALFVGRVSPEAEYYVGLGRLECIGANVGVQVDTNNPPVPKLTKFVMKGGEGLFLEGTGVSLGVGAASMSLGDLRIEDADKERTLVFHYPFLGSIEGTVTRFPPRLGTS